MSDLNEIYAEKVRKGELKPDRLQQKTVNQLNELCKQLAHYVPTPVSTSHGLLDSFKKFWKKPESETRLKGIYLVGPVGRGKSMMMDLFYQYVPVQYKMRTHFHLFMQGVHKEFHAFKSQNPSGEDPIPHLAQDIVRKAWLLCFDEFQINDIADAMILGRLFEHLFSLGVIIVSTSNVPINQLFQNRPGADAFKPFIELLQQNMVQVEVCSDTDYRLGRAEQEQKWLIGCNQENHDLLNAVFLRESGGVAGKTEILTVMGHQVTVPCAAAKVARFSFSQLCDTALGAGDYLALAQRFSTLIIEDIPRFNPENMNVIERFTTLIDVLYEQHVQLYVSAAADCEDIYSEKDRAFFFARTLSRLHEMQSHDWTK